MTQEQSTSQDKTPTAADLVPLVRMMGISKQFGNVDANDNANFELLPGEVHGLLGENGAGKTSLMNALFGLYHPDAGEIYVRGEKVALRSPADAIDLGVGMVHQNFRNIRALTVAENVVLGLPSKSLVLDLDNPANRIAELSDRYRLDIDPRAPLWQLSAG